MKQSALSSRLKSAVGIGGITMATLTLAVLGLTMLMVTVAMMIGGAHMRPPVHPPVEAIARIVGATKPINSHVDENGHTVVEYPRPSCHIDIDLSKNPIELHTTGFLGITINSTTQICNADGNFVVDYLPMLIAITEEMKAHPEHGKHFEVPTLNPCKDELTWCRSYMQHAASKSWRL
jgi:hypothetical protein